MEFLRQRFELGNLYMTPGIGELDQVEVLDSLIRHAKGDWGEELGEEDKKSNEDALKSGLRLLSAYRTEAGVKFWIITEADRSVTTILLPEEY